MTVIFEQRGGGTAGTTNWLVERRETTGGLPGLIRFKKSTAKATQLDQVAQWLPEGDWNTKRWQPRPPTVPKWLIERVEAVLREGV
jgi:transposase